MCGPEFSDLEGAIWQRFQGQNVQLLGLNGGNESMQVLQIFVNTFQLSFPVLVQANSAYSVYAQSPSASPYPLDYIIDQTGHVAYFNTEYDPDAMVTVIDQLLGNSPAIAVAQPSLDFGPVALDQSAQLLLEISNEGSGELQIHTIAAGTEHFTTNLSALTVPPGTSRILIVTFSPQDLGPLADTLQLFSNDPVNPLLAVELQGQGTAATAVDDVPATFISLSNHPNPFNPATQIRFTLPGTGSAWLIIYDVQGRLVRHLLQGESLNAGEHVRRWDGRGDAGGFVPSGVYFARLHGGGVQVTHKMTLVR